jgi:hypothetical protein
MTTSNRLASIATRQRSTRIRDAFFAACVTLAVAVSVTTLSTACDAASVAQSSRR